jgi:mRNA interferase MazF
MKGMPSMTGYSRGDVVLVSFVFSDETGEKRRPAVVISSKAYLTSRNEAIIAAITSNTDRILVGDHRIEDWQAAGLLFPSVVTGIIRTVKQGMITGKLGIMLASDMQAIESNLRIAFDLKSPG